MSDYLELQAIIKDGSAITDVEFRNNRVYFRIDGYLFSTFSNYAHHEKNPLFDHPILDIQSREHNTAEGIVEADVSHKEIEDRLDFWHKHRKVIYKLVFLRAFELLVKENDEEKFMTYIDHHFDIMENSDHCDNLFSIIRTFEGDK